MTSTGAVYTHGASHPTALAVKPVPVAGDRARLTLRAQAACQVVEDAGSNRDVDRISGVVNARTVDHPKHAARDVRVIPGPHPRSVIDQPSVAEVDPEVRRDHDLAVDNERPGDSSVRHAGHSEHEGDDPRHAVALERKPIECIELGAQLRR